MVKLQFEKCPLKSELAECPFIVPHKCWNWIRTKLMLWKNYCLLIVRNESHSVSGCLMNSMVTLDNFFFSDEALFTLDGYIINSQLYTVWSTDNPHAYVDKAIHPPQIGVWCLMLWKRIVGPIFFTTAVYSKVYCDIIQQCVALLEPDERCCQFQQDGARPHTSNETMDCLQEFFGDWLIFKGLWPPRSPDMTPLDFFWWGTLKNKVYETTPANLEQLKVKITSEISKISQQMLKKVFRNLLRRTLTCKSNAGGHFQHLL